MLESSCCFIGHRHIEKTPLLRERLLKILRELIENGTVNFLFGDHSEFCTLCYHAVTELKQEYPQVRRIHFRCCYEQANEYTMKILLTGYEKSICPAGIGKAGVATYVERDRAMIRESEICIFYYDENDPSYVVGAGKPRGRQQRKSGTRLAYGYAKQQGKTVINCRDFVCNPF